MPDEIAARLAKLEAHVEKLEEKYSGSLERELGLHDALTSALSTTQNLIDSLQASQHGLQSLAAVLKRHLRTEVRDGDL